MIFIATFVINARYVDKNMSLIPTLALTAGWLLVVIVRREILVTELKQFKKNTKK